QVRRCVPADERLLRLQEHRVRTGGRGRYRILPPSRACSVRSKRLVLLQARRVCRFGGGQLLHAAAAQSARNPTTNHGEGAGQGTLIHLGARLAVLAVPHCNDGGTGPCSILGRALAHLCNAHSASGGVTLSLMQITRTRRAYCV